jgi:hypothetical protein
VLDPERVVAEAFAMINVPTVVWIDDEDGRVVRAPDVAFASDAFIGFHGVESAPHTDALRRWVTTGVLPDDSPDDGVHRAPSHEEQLARAHLAVAREAHRRGEEVVVRWHLARAAALAPDDWTIRRGTMPWLGVDPMTSDEFVALFAEWSEAGRKYYR